jgi:hypothetical protein
MCATVVQQGIKLILPFYVARVQRLQHPATMWRNMWRVVALPHIATGAKRLILAGRPKKQIHNLQQHLQQQKLVVMLWRLFLFATPILWQNLRLPTPPTGPASNGRRSTGK